MTEKRSTFITPTTGPSKKESWNTSSIRPEDVSRSSIRNTRDYSSSSVAKKSSGGKRSAVSVSSTTPQVSANSKIIAIVEGRGKARGEIGMACIDLKNPVLQLSQFADTQAYLRLAVQLNVLNPIEVVMPSTIMDGGMKTKLICRIQELFPEITTVTVHRKYFNETMGLQLIKELCASEYKNVEIEVNPKYYCLSACSALLKYVEFKSNMVYAQNSLKIVYSTSAYTTMISTPTARTLELVTNQLGKAEHSLYGTLNHTLTPGGDRLLRANILQPPCDINTINTRLNCITELIENEGLFYNLKSVIGKFIDTEHLLSLCVQIPKEENVRSCEQKITNVICLKHALELVKPLRNCLEPCTNPLFQTYHQVLSDARFEQLLESISLVLHSDARYQRGVLSMHMQKCFAVKPNINGLLDVARRAYSESVKDISDIVKQLEKQHELPLNVSYSVMRGFFIQIPNKLLPAGKTLPSTFLKVNRIKNFTTCTTEDLIKLNDRIQESLNEIYIMSDSIINEVLNEIRGNVGCLYSLTEAVSTIDFLLSLAHVCTLSDHVKPEFTDTLAIRLGRHPVIEKIIGTTFIANDTYLCPEMNFIVLSGGNMSGKSTYLKQVAVLQIMAQMGAYVPADYASFKIADQILAHMGSGHDIEKNFSTFMLQMKEANFILQHATENSLIVMDELGKGTNHEEGCAIAFAICEKLLMSKAFVICTTHFRPLTQLSCIYPNVENYHFETRHSLNETEGFVTNFTHKLISGPCTDQYYGLKLAKISSMPRSVVATAESCIKTWSRGDNYTTSSSFITDDKKQKIQVVNHLLQLARNSLLDEDSLREHLQELQSQCTSTSDYQSDFTS